MGGALKMGDENTTDTTVPTNAATTDGVENAPTSEPELKFTQRQLDEHFNKMFTGRIGRLEKAFRKQLDDAVAAMRGQPAPPPVDDAQAQAMSALESMKALREQEAAAHQQRERDLLARELRSEVEHQLATLGAINIPAARALLISDGLVRHNEAGDLEFVDGDNVTDLQSGLRAWLDTEQGRHHQKPRGGGIGSGTVFRGGADRLRTAEPSKAEQRRDAMGVLGSWVLGGRK